jgi:hypothetical protein
MRQRWSGPNSRMRGLTFELSGPRRVGAWPARCMMTASASRAKCQAGGGPLERRVRAHSRQPALELCHGGDMLESCCDAEGQSVSGHRLGLMKDDGAVALELEVTWEQGLEGFDQSRLAVEVHGVLSGLGLLPVDSNRTSALAASCEVGGFTPLQCFLEFAHAWSGRSRAKDELAKCQEPTTHGRRIGFEGLRDGSALKGSHSRWPEQGWFAA